MREHPSIFLRELRPVPRQLLAVAARLAAVIAMVGILMRLIFHSATWL
jgi:hypothetical protein